MDHPQRQNSEEKSHPLRACLLFLAALPGKMASWFSASFIGRFFFGYDRSMALLDESRAMHSLRDSRLKHLASRVRYRVASFSTKSRPIRLFRLFIDMIRRTKTRCYGLFFLTFGIYTILVYTVKYFAFEAISAERDVLYVGAAVILLSLPMLISGRSLNATLQENRLLFFFLYRVAGLRIRSDVKGDGWQFNATSAFLLGSAFGVAGFFVSPFRLLLALFGVVLFFLLLSSPEFCLLSSVFLAPFLIFFEHPTLLLASILIIGMVGYAAKLLIGKRLFSFEPLDIAVLALVLLYLLSCLFTSGGAPSVQDALLSAVLLSGYFLAVNLLTTPLLIQRAVHALVCGGAIVTLIGLLQQLTGNAVADWLDSSAYAYIDGRITATFANPNVLSVYLLLLLPFTMVRMLRKDTPAEKLLGALLFAAVMAALIYTWSRGAWFGAIAALIVFVLLSKPILIYILLPVGVAAPFLLNNLLAPILRRLFSVSVADSSVYYRTGIWNGVWQMLGDHFLGGIGVGEEAFRAVYPYYALSGAEAATHSHSLYLQFFVEFGLPGLLLLLAFLLLLFQCLISHQREETDDALRLLSIAAGCGIFAVLINGLSDYVFYNSRIFFLFFAVVGIASAASRVGRRERRRSDRSDHEQSDSYDLDIEIDG